MEIKLKSLSPLFKGIGVEARLTTDHPVLSYGQKILVVETGDALGTRDVSLAYYRLVRATANKIAELLEAGYRIPIIEKAER